MAIKLVPASAFGILAWIFLAVLVCLPTSPASAAAEQRILEEIVVTARKRAETLQDVPMSVSAFSADDLENQAATDLSQIGKFTPGLYYELNDHTRPLIYVRGIGTRAYDAGSDPSVGLFVDGAYRGRFGAINLSLMDVERVEVLKGPQGTLYGRNTIGGAISVVTRDPGDETEIDASAEIGSGKDSEDDIAAGGITFSTPVVEDRLWFRIAASTYKRDGFLDIQPADVRAQGVDTTDVMAKVVWTPSSAFEARLNLTYSDLSDTPISFNSNDLGGTAPAPGPLAPGVVPLPPTGDLYVARGSETNTFVDRQSTSASLKLSWQRERAEFVSITSVQSMDLDELNEVDGSELDYNINPISEDTDSFSQEFRFSGGAGDFSWLLGAYYHKDEIDRVDHILFQSDALFTAQFGVNVDWGFGVDVESTSKAAFGQADWTLNDNLTLTLGMRYSDDEKDALYNTTSNVGAIVVPYTSAQGDDWTSTDGTLSLSYDFNDNLMGYFTYSTGYKPGGFQFIALDPIRASSVFDSEEVDSIELGVKSTLLDSSLRLNASLFQLDYKDLQLLRLTALASGLNAVVISNAGQSTIQGLELEGNMLLGEYMSMSFGFAWLDATFDEYVFSPGVDFSGNKLPRAPEYSANFALHYDRVIGPGLFHSTLAYNWQDEAYLEADNNEIDPDSKQKAHGLVNLNLSYSVDDWTLSLWGRNLTNEEYRRSVLNSTGFSQRQLIAEPRTTGFKVEYSFR